ncbi:MULTISPECIES: methyltransferase domain-containing protein [Catenuloplanes]|uniref:Ubiquinone/menaquinone biosynthesis C-methylase UbiE n=1 Tax=Catenuloplanes niger TaxID=587534 RepID=A0AAE3ZZ79_9ACTN|nr:methyltransferase domain-containing protein [Catenuloplanes niger]MDR7327677.1 ubiquinone/menaquinone biosynthesis C-methylase UbiE [Catenuloplanes niger]
MSDGETYVLGYSDAEHRRLRAQARLLQPWTEHFLTAGGLRENMVVLDLGSGAGDVTMAAADVVGPGGRVIGIDRDAGSVARATRRAAEAGYAGRVEFRVGTLEDVETDIVFDAVIGRYILLYLRTPASALRRVAGLLRTGGVTIFHEIDLTEPQPTWPACDVWDDSYRLLATVYRAAGAVPDFGRRFHRTFLDAGLPAPEIESVTPVGGPASTVVDWLAMSLMSLQPALTAAGLPLPRGLSFDDSLADRLRAALAERNSQIIGPAQYGAWARKR